jgi:hypothetical protein
MTDWGYGEVVLVAALGARPIPNDATNATAHKRSSHRHVDRCRYTGATGLNKIAIPTNGHVDHCTFECHATHATTIAATHTAQRRNV